MPERQLERSLPVETNLTAYPVLTSADLKERSQYGQAARSPDLGYHDMDSNFSPLCAVQDLGKPPSPHQDEDTVANLTLSRG